MPAAVFEGTGFSAGEARVLTETVRRVVETGGRAIAYTVYFPTPEPWTRYVAGRARQPQVDLELNVFGTFHCARAVLVRMTERGHGRIVNVASGAGNPVATALSAYEASRAAVIRLSELRK